MLNRNKLKMLLNNDLLFVGGSLIFIGVGILTLSYYNIFTTVNKSESLINTNSLSNLD